MLTKQVLTINFKKGLNRKSDPFQLQLDEFFNLENVVFDKDGRINKRNGFAPLASLPTSSSTFLTTFSNNLTAIGSSIYALSEGTNTWVNKGALQPINLSTLSLVRSNSQQTQVDAAVAANGLACVVYTDNPPSGIVYKYAVIDSATGQNIINPTAIPVSSGVVTGSPRVFLLGAYFIIVITNVISTVHHLQYVAISTVNPTVVTANTDIASSYVAATTVSWDGAVANNRLFIAYNTTTGGQAIKVTYLTSTLTLVTAKTFAGQIATMMSVTVDTAQATPIVYASYYDSAGSTGRTLAVDQNLNTILAPTAIISTGSVANITSSAYNGVCTVYFETPHAYSYDSGIATNFLSSLTVTQGGTVTSLNGTTLIRSLGLASKAFLIGSTSYVLGIYSSTYQPTYFLLNSSAQIVAKLAYENGGSYYTVGLPSVSVSGTTAYIPYMFKDLIAAANPSQNAVSNTPVYSQTGLNLATLSFQNNLTLSTAEIAQSLQLSGGFLWQYDGTQAVEQNFFLFPDSIEATWSASGGSIHAQPDGATNTKAYAYQVTYEWTDNSGNIHRSSPSIPIFVTTTSNGTTGSITINVPTLRLTYKTASPVRIRVYRWSVAQPVYYAIQAPSTGSPVFNDPTADSVTIVDTLADASIVGNDILYTTGGVIEDMNAPASNIMTLFDNRLWLVDAEDQNLLWFSKQVIEAVPVEMSDLLTLYIAPTTSAQGSTGVITAMAPLDDKLILFKKDAIYYINGSGPDNTGANNQYSPTTFITAVVGCEVQHSIVFIPNGLMFQSDKGIWLLGRDLSTQYIGAPVESFTLGNTVTSAVNIPETTQVRFTLNTGITLMYDYFFGRWSTFTNTPAISSTLYQNLHTYLNASGMVLQESPDKYLDNTTPVLIGLTTAWINMAGLQGFERLYQVLLLGQYFTPFLLQAQIAFDFNTAPAMSTFVKPNNYAPAYGVPPLYGSNTPYGAAVTNQSTDFEARLFPTKQKVKTFQLSLTEVYDPSFGVPAGEGLSLSGISCVIGVKKGFRTQSAARSFG